MSSKRSLRRKKQRESFYGKSLPEIHDDYLEERNNLIVSIAQLKEEVEELINQKNNLEVLLKIQKKEKPKSKVLVMIINKC